MRDKCEISLLFRPESCLVIALVEETIFAVRQHVNFFLKLLMDFLRPSIFRHTFHTASSVIWKPRVSLKTCNHLLRTTNKPSPKPETSISPASHRSIRASDDVLNVVGMVFWGGVVSAIPACAYQKPAACKACDIHLNGNTPNINLT